MDRQKSLGHDMGSLVSVLDEPVRYGVLDLQHAYELSTDSGFAYMDIVKGLAEVFLERCQLAQLHVSGERAHNGFA